MYIKTKQKKLSSDLSQNAGEMTSNQAIKKKNEELERE